MNLKIWHKIIIGISIPSFIAILGGVLTYGYLNNVKDRQGFVQIADDLKEEILEIRQNEKNFLLHKNSEYYEYFHDAIFALNNSINNISPKIIVEIGKEDFSLLRESIQVYSGLIDDLYKSYQQETNIVEKVREEGRKLEIFVAKEKHSAELSSSFILNLRRLEKNYMLFRDKVSYDRLDNTLSQLKNIIHFCVECIPYIEAIHNLFTTYKKSDSLVNDLQVTGDKLEEITDRIANQERQRIDSFLTQTKRLLLIALVLLCILVPLLVYKTATYIVAPIKRLGEITRKIAEGDMNLRAPLKEHDETYSLAVSFNKMLDHLQFTHESLEESLRLLHEKHKEAEKRVSLGLLVSGVAHELNNPLNNISLTAETMKEDLKELSRQQLTEYIQDILTQCERAQQIVERLLDFAGARKSSHKKKLDIISVVKESIHLIANQLKMNNINLKLDIPDSAFYVMGNISKLEEIFINIMVNAIEAMKNAGTLTVSAKPDTENKNIFIKISDTGCGIPEKELKSIFEPFFTTRPGEGTGLGLSVAHSIVTEHNGEVGVESKVNEGTTFTIRLPLCEESG
jgi:signal transduction histidine kinase